MHVIFNESQTDKHKAKAACNVWYLKFTVNMAFYLYFVKSSLVKHVMFST